MTTTNAVLNNKLSVRDYAGAAMFAAVMAVCSWISIPAAVPFTLQTFGVFLAVGLLGGKRGTLAIAVYLLLGAVGLPVFAGFSGGLGYMMGATGGYIVGFLFSALVMWLIEKLFGNSLPVLAASMILGLIVCYAFGTAWFMTVYTKNTGAIGLGTALGWCVIPYIVPDVIKIILATLLSRRLRPVLANMMI
ncbi:MAG: biotin transporter BioY [Mogibacterium sp.]|nr:biotin transporter BioY [Mogibacterium sp.]MBR2540498.1 biotin transporter BioY [Mogibacterium sp.]